MAKVNKKNIEMIFSKIDANFTELNYYQKMEILNCLEEKANVYNGEKVSEVKALEISFEKIKYHFARIYGEGKAKSTLVNLKKFIDFIEYELQNIKNLKDSNREINVIKDLITHLEITLNLDISFYTSLINLYQDCLETESLNFNDARFTSERRNNR